MATSNTTLTPKQELLVGALLTHSTIQAAATAAGVSERQAHRWIREPMFSAAYRAARRDAVQQAIARLQQTSSAAVMVMLSLMADRSTPASVRLSAAKMVLEFALKAVELEEIETRLTALEAAVKDGRR